MAANWIALYFLANAAVLLWRRKDLIEDPRPRLAITWAALFGAPLIAFVLLLLIGSFLIGFAQSIWFDNANQKDDK